MERYVTVRRELLERLYRRIIFCTDEGPSPEWGWQSPELEADIKELGALLEADASPPSPAAT